MRPEKSGRVTSMRSSGNVTSDFGVRFAGPSAPMTSPRKSSMIFLWGCVPGLFDVLGTEDEWLHDAFNPHPPPPPVPEREVVGTGHQRLVRNSMGAAWHSLRLHTWKSQATTAFASLRLARTLSVPGDGRATVAIPKSSHPNSTRAGSERISH